MPDFEAWLERELVHEIATARQVRRRRVAAGAATVGIGALAAFASLAGTGGESPIAPETARARPYPAIVYRVAATPAPTDAEIGVTGAQAERARSFPVGPYTGYVVPDARGNWCISVPDLATDRPDVERGTSCTSAPDFRRYGLYVRVGPVAAAAVPPGAPAPQRVGRFPARPVAVNGDDIAVVTDLKRNQDFALRYKPGVHRGDGQSVPLSSPPGICTDGRRVDRPGDCYRPGMTDLEDMCAAYPEGRPPGPCVLPEGVRHTTP
jgi:hypothetical protein